jgi:MFS family permease
MDTSIIGVALPAIQQQFSFSQSELHWIFSAYVIVFGALLLLGGRLSDTVGQHKIFVIGFAILGNSGMSIDSVIRVIANAKIASPKDTICSGFTFGTNAPVDINIQSV